MIFSLPAPSKDQDSVSHQSFSMLLKPLFLYKQTIWKEKLRSSGN